MKISIGNDHAGTEYKNGIIGFLRGKETYSNIEINIKDYGTNKTISVDYSDFAHPVAKDVNRGDADFGIVICGSGNGVAMTTNKYRRVRAALCWNNEIAKLSRRHNDANILAIPARFVSYHQVLDMVYTFLTEDFDEGRHSQRVEKLSMNIDIQDFEY